MNKRYDRLLNPAAASLPMQKLFHFKIAFTARVIISARAASLIIGFLSIHKPSENATVRK